jgi:hypothetical protein
MIPYIEDVYPLFYGLVEKFDPSVATAAKQFKTMCQDGKQFTDKQAGYLLSIMSSHKHQVPVDLSPVLDNPSWKLSFRQIDTGKRVWITDNNVHIQFPFSIKANFESEFDDESTSWNSELRYRTGSLFDINVIQLYDFALRHGFEIDPSFETIAFETEDCLAEEKQASPHSVVIDKQVYLVNSTEETDTWFDSHKTGNRLQDIFLAKHMGYLYAGRPRNLVEQIAALPENAFWLNDIDRFLLICHHIQGKVCIVLDRASNNYYWLQDFIEAVKRSPISMDEVKYGSAVKGNNPLNDIVIEYGLNKNVRSGKIIISIYRPNNWLIDQSENVMMLVTNNIYPSTNVVTREWLDSHPCVIHLSEYKPTIHHWSKNLVKL